MHARVYTQNVFDRYRKMQESYDKPELSHADERELYVGYEDESVYAGPWCLGSH